MIEFIKLARKRGVVADALHIGLNIIFACSAIFLTIAFETPFPAILLVVLSKWRVIAVRPRYWGTNLIGSLSDLIFGIGLVIISWTVGQFGVMAIASGQSLNVQPLTIQIIIGLIYSSWLVLVKPRYTDRMVSFQALASQFIGLTAVFFVSKRLSLEIALILSFVIAFATARKFFSLFEEKSQGLLASVWGLLVMELAFVSWHWAVFYKLLTPLVLIPQIALIVTAISVIAARVYRAWSDDRQVTWDELGYPVIFTTSLTLLVLFGFSGLF